MNASKNPIEAYCLHSGRLVHAADIGLSRFRPHVLAALHRFAESGEGDVKALRGREELRLRIGDYRLFFVCPDADTIEVRRVLHRREVYR